MLEQLTTPFPWSKYSRKLATKILRARSAGYYTEKDAEERRMRLAKGTAGQASEGNEVHLYWLVDPEDGVIVDAKFQLYGQSALIGAAEGTCGLLIGKNYDQARRMSADLVDQHLRDRSDQAAFPLECAPHINLVLEAVDRAAESCEDLPLAAEYAAPPVTFDRSRLAKEGGYPGWEGLDKKQKIAVIEDVIAREIRPYIELDAGGVEILDLVNDRELIIAYQGACTSCFSATGATLSYIQQTVRALVSNDLVVIPDM